MAQHSIQVDESIRIDIPIEELWNITALKFDKIGEWSSGVKGSEGYGTSTLGAVCNERQCVPTYKGFKKTTERIIDYQPDNYQFTYQIVEGLPGMVQKATNTWTHQMKGENTILTMSVHMQLQGLMGGLMKRIMQGKMKKILKENLEELKVYAETGNLHHRKKEAIAKYE